MSKIEIPIMNDTMHKRLRLRLYLFLPRLDALDVLMICKITTWIKFESLRLRSRYKTHYGMYGQNVNANATYVYVYVSLLVIASHHIIQ